MVEKFTTNGQHYQGVILVKPDGTPYEASFQIVEGGEIETTALAKETKQDTQITALDGINSKLAGALTANVSATALPLPTGAASSANQNTIITALNNEYALLGAGINVTVQNASMPITAASLPLPTGAATSAKQDALQAAIDDGIDVTVINTVPVTMANRAVTVSNPVEISNTSIAVSDGGGSLTVDGTVAATQSGTWTSTLATGSTVAVSTVGSPVAVTDNGQSLTVDGTVGVSGVVQVADNGGSITVDATSLPLPTGAATSANQATEIGYLGGFDAKIPLLGQAAKATSVPVTIASDQGNIPVAVSNFPATQPVSLASVPTHAVTQSGTFTTTPAVGLVFNTITTASTNAGVIKSSVGSLYELTISNPTATAAYVKIYSKSTAPTVGTDVPIFTIPISANSALVMDWGPVGKRVATGIAYAVTGAIAASDTTTSIAGIQLSGTYL